jgi:hypothetical protein
MHAGDEALRAQLLGPPGPAQRRALAKAITLLESTRADHRLRADGLLDALLPAEGGSLRLGISGVPGVGKSTFIEALGLQLVQQGHRVAVLAVDPSSSVSGGSILGDKTRMERLSVHERAFIRPSPTSGTLGGVAEKTRESMRVCEAAGFDIVIVETVGVGQSEVAVAGMPHPRWGQKVVAFVKLRGNADAATLDAHCRNSELVNFKRPRDYVFVREIPKSPVGKVLRRKLQAGEYEVLSPAQRFPIQGTP